MKSIKNRPFIFSTLIIISIYILNKLPLSKLFIASGLNEVNSNFIENSVINTLVFIGIYIIAINQKIKIWFFGRFIHVLYYLPLLIYLFVFSGGFNVIKDINSRSINTLLLFAYETFTSAILEAWLFRGLILGLFLTKYNKSKSEILKAVFFSSLIFGSIHFLNFCCQTGASLKGVTNQIYATTCIGFMYGAVYLKTKNLFILTLIHFLSNFAIGIEDLKITEVEKIVSIAPSLLENIVTEIFRIVIFGVPFMIGMITINKMSHNEIKLLTKSQTNR